MTSPWVPSEAPPSPVPGNKAGEGDTGRKNLEGGFGVGIARGGGSGERLEVPLPVPSGSPCSRGCSSAALGHGPAGTASPPQRCPARARAGENRRESDKHTPRAIPAGLLTARKS